MKQVLVETQLFKPSKGLLSEGKMSERGNPLVHGILATCEVKNDNGRFYSEDLWRREIQERLRRDANEDRDWETFGWFE